MKWIARALVAIGNDCDCTLAWVDREAGRGKYQRSAQNLLRFADDPPLARAWARASVANRGRQASVVCPRLFHELIDGIGTEKALASLSTLQQDRNA